MLRSAIFAAVATGVAVAGAGGASAMTRGSHDGWNRYHVKPVYHTSVQCVRGQKVLLRINQWGKVVSRSVIGHCGPQRHVWWWR